MNLSAAEARVLGCLLEKQLTTPDIYPLTLNGLRLACNQSTNRDPVVDYDDAVLRDALRRLERRGYARLASGRGSRAPKYRHLLAEALPLSGDEHAILCVLLLRGPQTPGELKQRAERMHAFADLGAVHDTLQRLIARALVARLERRPGQKEERYGHLLSADLDEPDPAMAPGSAHPTSLHPATASAGSRPSAAHVPATPASVTAGAAHAVSPDPAAASTTAMAAASTYPSAASPDSPYPAPSPNATNDAVRARAKETPADMTTEGSSTEGSSANGTPAGLDGLEQRVARLERAVEELRATIRA